MKNAAKKHLASSTDVESTCKSLQFNSWYGTDLYSSDKGEKVGTMDQKDVRKTLQTTYQNLAALHGRMADLYEAEADHDSPPTRVQAPHSTPALNRICNPESRI